MTLLVTAIAGTAAVAIVALIVTAITITYSSSRRSPVTTVAEDPELSTVTSRAEHTGVAARQQPFNADINDSGERVKEEEDKSRGSSRFRSAQPSHGTEKQSDEAHGGPPSSDPVKDALESVAVVRLPDGHGSGFVAAPGIIVTNYHVIRLSRIADVRIGFPDNPSVRGRLFSAQLLAEDPIADLAILRVPCDVTPLTINESFQHSNGQKVVAIGSPGTGGPDGGMLANLTTDGRLGPQYPLSNGSTWWALAMSINPGNSGGPIIHATSGHVVGVVVAKFTKTESQALAVPLPKLVETLRATKTDNPDSYRRAAALHRARYCLAHMSQLLRLAAVSFDKSCEAAMSTETNSEEAKLAAFNAFKSEASRVLSDEFATFETTIKAEVFSLRNDTSCDMAVRLAMEKLHATIETQVSQLQKPVPLRDIGRFLRDFRSSLKQAVSLTNTIARSLALELDDGEDEK